MKHQRWLSGPRRAAFGVALLAASVGLLLLAGSAAAGKTTTLYSQFEATPSNGYGSDLYWGYRLADDFVVPAGYSWHVTSVFAPGADFAKATSVNVTIYADSAGSPGASVYTVDVASDSFTDAVDTYWNNYLSDWTGGDLTIPIDTTLSAGTYWLSVRTLDVNNAWYWSGYAPTTVSNSQAVLDFGYGWQSLGAWFSGPPLDLMFTLTGTVARDHSTIAPTDDVTVSPSRINFGKVNVGYTTDSVTVTFTNTSSYAATYDTDNVISDTVSGYGADMTNCGTLAAGASCTATFSVTAPSTKGHFSGEWNVQWIVNGVEEHSVVHFSGSAIAP